MPDHKPSPQRTSAGALVVRPWLESTTSTVGDRTVVALRGEIDMDTEQSLHLALHDALDRSTTGADLDLSAVGFCDCSGLNVLLGARRYAVTHRKTLILQTAGRATETLLALTGTRHLFNPVRAPGPSDDVVPAGNSEPEMTAQDLHAEAEELQRAVATQPTTDLKPAASSSGRWIR
ncbi:STAS domain-containing protein [Streptomyces sp. NPDC102279]|uniref:STAS domain-containing protein n=1 Tax=Streptomyces sp. NPDC102279 TaxID=3366153 RepID=UPI0037FF9F0D